MDDKALKMKKLAFKLGYELGLKDVAREQKFIKEGLFEDIKDMNSTVLTYGLLAALGVPFLAGIGGAIGKNLFFKGPYGSGGDNPLLDLEKRKMVLTEWDNLVNQAKAEKALGQTKDNVENKRTGITSKGILE